MVADVMVKPLQARKFDSIVPSTLPVWDHKDNFKCMERKKSVADKKVQQLPARKMENLSPSTLPVWNHKDNFRFM
jgi:hypothetical protein